MRATKSQIKKEIKNLYTIEQQGRYYFLSESISLRERLERERESSKKIKDISQYISVLSSLPGVEMIGVSGSVAAKNAKMSDDIDLFIVSSPHMLWISRICLLFVFAVLGKRRKSGQKIAANLWCANLWRSRDNLVFTQTSLFTAREIAQLKVLYAQGGVYEYLLTQNKWIQEYLPNIDIPQINIPKTNRFTVLLAPLNFAAYGLQLLYMKRKRTNEQITYSSAAFHPQDKREQISNVFHKKFRECLSKEKRTISEYLNERNKQYLQPHGLITPGS
jgi:hypothetical protein